MRSAQIATWLVLVVTQPAHARTAPQPRPARPIVQATFRTPTIAGALNPRLAQGVLRRHRAMLRLCYEMVLDKRPDLEGTATLTFEIDERGHVRDPASRGFDPDVDACLSGLARRWQFPAPRRDTVTVTQVIRFTRTHTAHRRAVRAR